MAKYIALHTLKVSGLEIKKIFNYHATDFAKAQAAGELPAKCYKTWNPIPHGRTDYMFCLWEADKPEDIETSLGQFFEHLTVDNIKVDEIDRDEFVKTL